MDYKAVDETRCNSLEHYGILGMRWGVRRSKNQLARASKNAAYRAKAENKLERMKRKNTTKNRRLLSDDEIKAKLARLKLEKEYDQLSQEDLSPGKKATQKFLSEKGNKIATTVTAGIAGWVTAEMVSYGKKQLPKAKAAMNAYFAKKKA